MEQQTQPIQNGIVDLTTDRQPDEIDIVEQVDRLFREHEVIELFPNWKLEADIVECLDKNSLFQQYVVSRNLKSKLIVIATKTDVKTEAARTALNTKCQPEDFIAFVIEYVLPAFLKAKTYLTK